MSKTRKKPKWRRGPSTGQKLIYFALACLLVLALFALLAFGGDRVKETKETTFGIDVARYQGTIDWEEVSQAGIDFAMIRLGYRSMAEGVIEADTNARYNLQEASRYGIQLGAYFFSTAVTEEEAVEEARWVAEMLSQYPVTYPVAYDCELFTEPESRQYGMSREKRTEIALAFLDEIEKQGYEGMFYASKNDMEEDSRWIVSEIQKDYKIWVAQYPEKPYPETEQSSYSGQHSMWQYSRDGSVPGIEQPVDLNIAYFGYDSTCQPQNATPPDAAKPDPEALMAFEEVYEQVTAKETVNLRDTPSQDEDAEVLHQLENGQVASRTGISESGWSRVVYEGGTYYAVSSYLTTDLNYRPPAQPEPTEDDGIDTEFYAVNEQVTAKDRVNLRDLPGVDNSDSQIVGELKNGQVATRVGVSDNGWSKLEYLGETVYAVSSYLTTDVDGTGEVEDDDIDTVFEAVNEQVTPKDAVNLRTMPSVEHKNSQVVVKLKHGEVVTRTGINADVGWSRVEYNGQILYCVSSYLQAAE